MCVCNVTTTAVCVLAVPKTNSLPLLLCASQSALCGGDDDDDDDDTLSLWRADLFCFKTNVNNNPVRLFHSADCLLGLLDLRRGNSLQRDLTFAYAANISPWQDTWRVARAALHSRINTHTLHKTQAQTQTVL